MHDSGLAANGEYIFKSTWRSLRILALRIDRVANPHPMRQLEDIMIKAGSYIRKPEEGDDRLSIWGTDQQVADTKAALRLFEQDIRNSPANSQAGLWAKSNALDGRAEHRLERQARRKEFDALLKQAALEYPYQAALLWPSELDMKKFEDDNDGTLDHIRDTFFCRLGLHSSPVPYIEISANTEKDIVQIFTRMSNLVKETIASRDQLMKLNLVYPPAFDIFRDRVGLQDKDPWTDSYLPTLYGKPATNEAEWNEERRKTHINNRKKIKNSIDSCIKRLRISQHHVRMRVVFGELGFTLFQKPADGGDTYSFTDFYTMVTKGRTNLLLNSLPIRQGEIADLPAILNSMDAFRELRESYGAFFDFPGSSPHTILRLEAVFDPVGQSDFQVLEQRWIEVRDKISKFQISLYNFGRPDYQLTLDAFPLHTNKTIKGHMAAFQNNLSFERPRNGIASLPRRRVKYPQGHQGLRSVSEITVMRWRYKDTDGIFELRRKDVYDETVGRYNAIPVSTSWYGLYYYSEWDNLLGEFANVNPGEDISWEKSVATFFPESNNDDGKALPQGFKSFITEVEEIQDLLTEGIGRLAKGKGKATGIE